MRTFMTLSSRLFAVLFAVASLATAAQAQSFAVKVNVPFAFQTSSGLHLPAGVYVISDTGKHTLLISGAKTTGFVMIWNRADDATPATPGKAVFTRYGDRYYLHSVSMTGSRTRMIFNTSKQERHLQLAGVEQKNTEEWAMLDGIH